MIILVIELIELSFGADREGDPPVAAYVHGPTAPLIALEHVKSQKHERPQVFKSLSLVQNREYSAQLLSMPRVDSPKVAPAKEAAKPFVPKADDHSLSVQ